MTRSAKRVVAVGDPRPGPNPGVWMLHCHNGYHMEAGIMTTLNYTG